MIRAREGGPAEKERRGDYKSRRERASAGRDLPFVCGPMIRARISGTLAGNICQISRAARSRNARPLTMPGLRSAGRSAPVSAWRWHCLCFCLLLLLLLLPLTSLCFAFATDIVLPVLVSGIALLCLCLWHRFALSPSCLSLGVCISVASSVTEYLISPDFSVPDSVC